MVEPLRLHILASGSKGNAALVEGPGGMVLVDCGISRRQVLLRAADLGLDASEAAGLVLTHEHSDHVSGLKVWCRHWQGRVVASPGTAAALDLGEAPIECVVPGEAFEVAGLRIRTFPTSHDVAEPMGLVVESADDRLAYLTDTGVITGEALRAIRGARIVALESNHDPTMLAEGDYPSYLKARISGPRGHLSNDQAAEALPSIVGAATEYVVAMHLSLNNNLPSRAVGALASSLGAEAADSTFTRAVLPAARRPRGTRDLHILAASQGVPLTVG